MNRKVQNSLDNSELYYEEYEDKPVKASKSRLPQDENPIKERVSAVIKSVRERFSKLKLHRKPSKKLSKDDKKALREQQKRGILGIGLLFVVVSIAYSSYVILNGVDSIASKVMLVPQVAFALRSLIKAFSKIYK